MALLVVLSMACGDDAAQADDDATSSSSGSTDAPMSTAAPTSSGPSTTVDPDTSSGTAPETTSTGEDSTTGATPMGHARFVVRAYSGAGELFAPALYDYTDGVLSAPFEVAPDLPPNGGTTGVAISESGRYGTYCRMEVPVTMNACFLRDLGTDPPGPEQPFGVGPLAEATWTEIPKAYEASGLLVFQATLVVGDETTRTLNVAAVDDGVLAEPRVLLASTPGQAFDDTPSIAADGARVAYTAGPVDGALEAFVISTLDEAATGVRVHPELAPSETVTGVGFVPNLNAVTYGIEDSELSGPAARWIVDLSSGTPGTPLRIDEPSAAPDRGPMTFAPDGHAVVYWVGDQPYGDVRFVDLADGVPHPHVVLNGPETGNVLDSVQWSPDSRWLVYTAEDPLTEADDHYVVAAAEGSPGTPVRVTDGAPGEQTGYAIFTDDPRWLYVTAPLDSEAIELYRIDLAGDEPGEPQRVNAPLPAGGYVGFDIDVSDDGSTLTYVADQGAAGVDELWVVDVSGDTPGVASRISGPVPDGHYVVFTGISPDGSVAYYHVWPFNGTKDGVHQPWLVDLADPAQPIQLAPDGFGVFFLPE